MEISKGAREVAAEDMKLTVRDIMKLKGRRKITMIAVYDYFIASIADNAGIDILLVGDSVAMNLYGMENTLNVPVSMIENHVQAVAKAAKRSLVVGDMPFMSYETSVEDALRNAARLVRAGADAVKIEGVSAFEKQIRKLIDSGIPVMTHVGLTPQRYRLLGGYRPQGKKAEDAAKIIREAELADSLGSFSIVIEFTAAEVAAEITDRISIPTICIGSGPYCDGQVLVITDLLGITPQPPFFAKNYANLSSIIEKALNEYKNDVIEGKFPAEQHYFKMKENEYDKLKMLLQKEGQD